VNLPLRTFLTATMQPRPGPIDRISGVSGIGENLKSWGSDQGCRRPVFQVSSFSVSHPGGTEKIWHRLLTTTATMQRPSSVITKCPTLLPQLPALGHSRPFKTHACSCPPTATPPRRGDSVADSVASQSPQRHKSLKTIAFRINYVQNYVTFTRKGSGGISVEVIHENMQQKRALDS
jgi:hypothetical protein